MSIGQIICRDDPRVTLTVLPQGHSFFCPTTC